MRQGRLEPSKLLRRVRVPLSAPMPENVGAGNSHNYPYVAQWSRAPGFEPGGCKFESCRRGQWPRSSNWNERRTSNSDVVGSNPTEVAGWIAQRKSGGLLTRLSWVRSPVHPPIMRGSSEVEQAIDNRQVRGSTPRLATKHCRVAKWSRLLPHKKAIDGSNPSPATNLMHVYASGDADRLSIG